MSDPTAAAKEAFSALVKTVGHQQVVAYMDVLSTTLLVYDVIINLHIEIEFIWMRRWTLLTVLYIIQCYLPFIDTLGFLLYTHSGLNLSIEDCIWSTKAVGWSFVTGIILSLVVLSLRVWAVWSRNLPVGIGLTMLLLACGIPAYYCVAQFLKSMTLITPQTPFPNLHGCLITGGSHIVSVNWILMMVYDSGTLILMLIPGLAAFRRGGVSELFKTVYEDG
ncbi:hypothetical protein L218DRAFT_1009591 [Marasmius fiardii PR-910]|nr:hypothetical protein L218DRAFT_1009591 [Marasmius fiardii PR-910]